VGVVAPWARESGLALGAEHAETVCMGVEVLFLSGEVITGPGVSGWGVCCVPQRFALGAKTHSWRDAAMNGAPASATGSGVRVLVRKHAWATRHL